MQYQHLIGRQFDMDHRNCYTLLRDFYRDIYGIELTDYSCPTNWWAGGQMDLYTQLADVEGFELVHSHPRDWKGGDVIIMGIEAPVGNHCAVLLDNGKILHHLVGQLSTETAYGGVFRNNTLAVYRHREVAARRPPEIQVDVRDLLPPHVRSRLDDLRAAQAAAAGSADGNG